MNQPAQVEHLLELRRYAEAREALAALLSEQPDDVQLHGLLAQVLLGLDDLPGALAAGNRLVALAPEDEWGHRICAIVLDRMERHEEATAAAAEAVRLDPLNWATHQVFARAAVDARGRQYDARTAAFRAVELAPHEPSAHFTVGLVAQARGEDDLARQAYERTLALDPQHATALNNLTVLGGTRNLAQAAQGFGASLRHAPDQVLVQRNVESLAAVFVRRIYLVGLVAFLVGLATAMASDGVTPVTVGIAVAMVATVAGYTLHLVRTVPVGIRRFVLARMRSDPFLLANQALTVAMLVVALVTCLVPHGAEVGLVALRPIGFANVALVVWTFARR